MALLSIIIPVFNEPDLPVLIEKLYDVVFECEREIIIVDDGSTDGTREWLVQNQNFYDYRLIVMKKNSGKGAAVKQGLRVSRGTIMVIQDGDLEYEPFEIPGVIAPILRGKTKVCYGSRYLDANRRSNAISWIKAHGIKNYIMYLGGRLINSLFNFLCQSRLTDVSTCYKAFAIPFLKTIPAKGNGFELEHELTMKIIKQTTIQEVPIHYNPRSYNEGKKITIVDGIKIFTSIVHSCLINSFRAPAVSREKVPHSFHPPGSMMSREILSTKQL
ncbi:MAG: glycosyltransferase family 2 protein [Spirochaetales bacterium]|nr:glycosyltransferase family 2 protein [Spirochaetales bacterium]